MKRKLLHTLAAAAVLVPMSAYAADAPENLYIKGWTVNGQDWQNIAQTSKSEDGKTFYFQVKLTDGKTFKFYDGVTEIGPGGSAGSGNDKEIFCDNTYTMAAGGAAYTLNYNREDGAFSITVDYNGDSPRVRVTPGHDAYPEIEEWKAPDPIVPGEMPETLNLIGLVGSGGWQTAGNFVSCTAVDKEAGTITFTNAEITGAFAFCDVVGATTTADDCKSHDGFYGPSGEDKDAEGNGKHNEMFSKSGKGFTLGSVGGAGLYDIVVYFPEDARPYFTITRTGNIAKKYYFVGDMNDWFSTEFSVTDYVEDNSETNGRPNGIYIKRYYPGSTQYYYEICQKGKEPDGWDGKRYRIGNQADWELFDTNKAKWEFKHIGKINDDIEGDNWYVFDGFPNNIMTGQFQISDGTKQWGGEVYSAAKGIDNPGGMEPNWDNYKEYANCTITRDAISGQSPLGSDIIKQGNGQNFHLDCNAVYEAKIYLLPGENPKMIVAGDPVDFYLFYGVEPDDDGKAALEAGNARVRAKITQGKPNTNNYFLPGIWYGQYENGDRSPLPNVPENYEHMNLEGRNLVKIDLKENTTVDDFFNIKDENGNPLFHNYSNTYKLIEDIVKYRRLPNDMVLDEGKDVIWMQKIPNGFCCPAGRRFTLSLTESLNALDRHAEGNPSDIKYYTLTANHMYFFSVADAHVHVNAQKIEQIANVEVSYRVYGQDGLWNTIVVAPKNHTHEYEVIYDRRSIPKATATEKEGTPARDYGWVTLNSDYKNCTNWWGCDHKYHKDLDIEDWKYCVKDAPAEGVNALADGDSDRMQIASRYTHKYLQFRFRYSPKKDEGSFQFEPYEIYVPEAPRAVADNAKYNLNGHDYYLNLADDPIYTGIDGIFDDVLPGDEAGAVEDGEPVYYNLQGLRVEKPTRGLYIKVTGSKSEKVMF